LRAFTLLEIIIVMAMMGLLMGIGVGYLTNIKRAAGAAQSLAILRETATQCKQSSNGGTRAIFDLQLDPDTDRLFVGAAEAKPVLTHNFETLDSVSRDYPVEIGGRVEVVSDGYTGNAAHFGPGGFLEFAPQSSFAMTEGLSLAVWIRPDADGGMRQTLVKGEGTFEIQLLREQDNPEYDVLLKLNLRDAGPGRSVSRRKEFRTHGGVVAADGKEWTHLRVGFDGTSASIRVGGFERYQVRKLKRRGQATPTTTKTSRRSRIAIPESGAVRLTISTSGRSFQGTMDEFVLGGIFRSSDSRRELKGLELLRPEPPVRIVWRNGRLDPDEHASDVVLLFREVGGRQGVPPIEMKFSLYGLVTQRMAAATEGGVR